MTDDRERSGTVRVPPSASCLGISPAKAGGEKKCAAVILAAGGAVRMGAAKPALAFGDTTLVGAAIRTAREAGLEPVVVVTGYHHQDVEAAVGDSAVVVRNPDPDRGNMSSLLLGIDAVHGVDVVVVLLSDMPGVAAPTVDALWNGLLESGAGCGWTRYADGRGHPIAFTPEGIEAIGGLSGTKALWPYFDTLGDDERYVVVVDGPRPSDINTPTDYKKLVSG